MYPKRDTIPFIIHTLGYSKDDLLKIKRSLKKKFGIDVGLHRQKKDKFRLYVFSESADKFRKLIEPYVIPTLRYKLGEHMPKE